MSYENAPATTLLATNCACCRRPLLDATSVEIGMGPHCRKKHGYGDGPSEMREDANKLINRIAVLVNGSTPALNEILEKLTALRALGFHKVADHIVDGMAVVRIEEESTGLLAVTTPYSASAVDVFRSVQGRRWDRERKLNLVPRSSGAALFVALAKLFPNALAIGPKGAFVLATGGGA